MRRAFWDLVAQRLRPGELDKEWLVRLYDELRDRLTRWIRQGPTRLEVAGRLDTAIFRQLLYAGEFDAEELRGLAAYVFGVLERIQAPARDLELAAARGRVEAEFSRGGSTFSSAVVGFLKEAHALLDLLDSDMRRLQAGDEQ